MQWTRWFRKRTTLLLSCSIINRRSRRLEYGDSACLALLCEASEQDSQSDVDLLVEFEPGRKTFDNFMNLCFLLEDLFRRRVEPVTPESLSPYIKPNILEQAEYVTLAA